AIPGPSAHSQTCIPTGYEGSPTITACLSVPNKPHTQLDGRIMPRPISQGTNPRARYLPKPVKLKRSTLFIEVLEKTIPSLSCPYDAAKTAGTLIHLPEVMFIVFFKKEP